MLVAQSTFTHIRELYGPFRASVHEPVAALRMKFRSRYHFCEFFHVRRFDINDVEALVLYVQVPEVDAKVITTDKCLSIAVDGYAVNMVCMCIGICSSWYGGHNSVVVCHPW